MLGLRTTPGYRSLAADPLVLYSEKRDQRSGDNIFHFDLLALRFELMDPLIEHLSDPPGHPAAQRDEVRTFPGERIEGLDDRLRLRLSKSTIYDRRLGRCRGLRLLDRRRFALPVRSRFGRSFVNHFPALLDLLIGAR